MIKIGSSEEIAAEIEDLTEQNAILAQKMEELSANIDIVALEGDKNFTESRLELDDLRFRGEAIKRRISALMSDGEVALRGEQADQLKKLHQERVLLISMRNEKNQSELLPLFLRFAVFRSCLFGLKLNADDMIYLKTTCKLFDLKHSGELIQIFEKCSRRSTSTPPLLRNCARLRRKFIGSKEIGHPNFRRL